MVDSETVEGTGKSTATTAPDAPEQTATVELSTQDTGAASVEPTLSQESGTTSYLTWYIIGGIALVIIIVVLGMAWRRARRYG